MEKALIIGNAGSGKTAFARQLAEKLALPLVQLDRIYWCGSCTEYFDAQKVPFCRSVLTFNKQHRKDYYDLLSKVPNVNAMSLS